MNLKEFIKFGIVGGIGVIPNYFIFNIFRDMNVNFAWGLGILAGMGSNYILSSIWVFKERK